MMWIEGTVSCSRKRNQMGLFRRNVDLQYLPQMEAALQEVANQLGVAGMREWHPRIRDLMLAGDLKRLKKSLSEDFTSDGCKCNCTARVQAVLAIGAIGSDQAISALETIADYYRHSSELPIKDNQHDAQATAQFALAVVGRR